MNYWSLSAALLVRPAIAPQAEGTALTYDYIYSSIQGYNLLDYMSPVIHHTFITPGMLSGASSAVDPHTLNWQQLGMLVR